LGGGGGGGWRERQGWVEEESLKNNKINKGRAAGCSIGIDGIKIEILYNKEVL